MSPTIPTVSGSTALTSGATLGVPLSEESGAPATSVSLKGFSPNSSRLSRSWLRDGTAAPIPHCTPLDRFTAIGSSGSPRHTRPTVPDSSTALLNSLLRMKSIIASALPVLAPASFLPVGSFTVPRTAIAAGCWRHSDIRFTFTPTNRSPTLSPLQSRRTNGYAFTSPPYAGLVDWKVAGISKSRSIRVSTRNDPKISIRSARPNAAVIGKWLTSVSP